MQVYVSGRAGKKDLRAFCSPIEDQGELGSCTAHAGVGLMEWFQRRAFGRHLDMSRLFLYLVARRMVGIRGDEGCYLRTVMQAMVMFGVPPEQFWPYKTADFDREPDAFVYSLADDFKAYSYYRLTPNAGKSQLEVLLDHLDGGLPFMFGFTVFSNISNNGWIPEPQPGNTVLGGHAVAAFRYDDKMKAFLIRNSWGTSWGHEGYGWLPYSYVERGLADDFWTLIKANFVNTELFK
jgi:C1A family cysteine protease